MGQVGRQWVLILVLMEDTLRGYHTISGKLKFSVLILVLMEDTLRGMHSQRRCSCISLNPCFNGRYSQRPIRNYTIDGCKVLILVLMEDTLRAKDSININDSSVVLILVLMEDTLRDI